MADAGNDINSNVSEQAMSNLSSKATNVGRRAGKAAAKGAKRAMRRMSSKAANAVRKGLTKGIKAGAKAAVNIGKMIGRLIAELIAVIGVPLAIALTICLVAVVAWTFLAEECGSNESNDLDPAVQNPAIVDTETGITTALAMTEPQAVIDAYYKYMSACSFTKTYKNLQYVFKEPLIKSDFQKSLQCLFYK